MLDALSTGIGSVGTKVDSFGLRLDAVEKAREDSEEEEKKKHEEDEEKSEGRGGKRTSRNDGEETKSIKSVSTTPQRLHGR